MCCLHAAVLPLLLLQTGKFIPEKSNIWRDCCDGMYDWVKEHIMEVWLMLMCALSLGVPGTTVKIGRVASRTV